MITEIQYRINKLLDDKRVNVTVSAQKILDLVSLVCNDYYAEKSAYKNQLDVYQEEVAKKDMLINNLQNE